MARALAETTASGNAGARVLAGVAEALEWDAAALWEVDAGGTLRCTADWQPPERRLTRFDEFAAELRLESGIGLPGRVLASGEPVWIDDIRQDTGLPEAPAAVGDRRAIGRGVPDHGRARRTRRGGPVLPPPQARRLGV